jgi:hypothetical protein
MRHFIQADFAPGSKPTRASINSLWLKFSGIGIALIFAPESSPNEPPSRSNPMPSWTRKDERQYEKIKTSSKRRGASERRAKEIAARTVNKARRQRGDTPQSTTQGTGNPHKSLGERSKEELVNIAKELNIAGRSTMSKRQLVSSIRAKR